MGKQDRRERVWDELEERGAARFPYPPHGRIPNFAGADDAADRLVETDAWRRADAIKSNPDAPQLPVRRAALCQGKTVYMAVPRLRDEKCFLRLDPAEIEDTDRAATIGGSSDLGTRVGPDEMEPIGLIVSGSVAANDRGERIGKGEGYSDLEFAILREFGLVDDETTTVTTVHEIQVVDEAFPTAHHDVPMDLIVTPDRTIRTDAGEPRPIGIAWDELDDDRIEEIPILDRLRSQ
ncbi:5-formyltetrahydrofolate cyclo-ligase [Halosolutus gelatinilyticus]|uniref:5-formyltetrahydrofolate cyclo-ligase n=1 Tax=Halosolutus gelatinilyticus TaxID=2931975 RepID=UPI001FF49029|nr:5-formyltetrahydrofolate cyclo-ligase [Halosolutus gelatinilyticus]